MVSHDLKNTLAIINENAGLLDDLAIMSGESGVPTERVQAAAAKIAQQVTRSNTIIKNLNRFAHSGDTPVARAPVGDLLELMVALSTRKAAMRSVVVTVQCDASHQVELALFQLEAFFYRLLVHLYVHVASASSIAITSQVSGGGVTIRFAVKMSDGGTPAAFPGSREQTLLAALQGSCDVAADAIVVTLPAV